MMGLDPRVLARQKHMKDIEKEMRKRQANSKGVYKKSVQKGEHPYPSARE